jgi:ABC-2 type transport system permease protein
MNPARQYFELVNFQLRSMRAEFAFIAMIQVVLTLGLVLGFGYIIPDISETSATYLVTGAATQSFVIVGLVMLPQFIAQAKDDGRLDYFMTLPIMRELYLLAQLTVVAILAIPGTAIAVVFGAWHYGFSLQVDPLVIPVMLLAVLSLAGVGVALAVAIPHVQIVNAISQLVIFYVLFFAPVLLPKEQLPVILQHTADFMPPTYAADAVRASLTSLPGTHLARSLLVMSGFAAASMALGSLMIRRRG